MFQDLVKEAEKVDHMFEGEMEVRERHLKYGRNPISADLMERLRKHPLPPKMKCKNGCGRWNADSRFYITSRHISNFDSSMHVLFVVKC